MELRLLIPNSPRCCQHSSPNLAQNSPQLRYRGRNYPIHSTVSNPEYQSAGTYDLLEITIKEKSRAQASGGRRSHNRTSNSDGVLSPSKSTPNLRSPRLRDAPRPPPPPPLTSITTNISPKKYQPRDYEEADTPRSFVTTNQSPAISQPSTRLGGISPMTPGNDQYFFRPSFHEGGTGIAVDFEDILSPANPDQRIGVPYPIHALDNPQEMIYELEDTSRSPARSQPPESVLESQTNFRARINDKPLPLIPCPKSIERKIYREENRDESNYLKKKRKVGGLGISQSNCPPSAFPGVYGPGNHEARSSTGDLYQICRASSSVTGTSGKSHYITPRSQVPRSSLSSSDGSASHSKSPDRYGRLPVAIQPDKQQPKNNKPNANQTKKKKPQKPFSFHVGRFHLVFGSTKQELADSRRNINMYRDFEASNPSVCQDSLGRIRYL